MSDPGNRPVDRRHLLATASAAVATAVLPAAATSPAFAQKAEKAKATAAARNPGTGAPGQRFFTQTELQTLDELAEAIIPADENSGGGKAAKVADAIDLKLGENLDANLRQSWRDDIAEINRLATLTFKRPFVRLTPAERERLLTRVSRNEANPKEPGEYAFGTIKWEVALTYYKTKIGIHDELRYQGNVLLDEFAGTDVGKP